MGQGTLQFIEDMAARGGPTEGELWKMEHQAAIEAAAAREAGDEEGYQYWRARMAVLGRIREGYGNTQDLLDLERATSSPLEQIGGMMQSVALGAAVVLGFILFTRSR